MRASALLAPLVFGSLLASCAAQVNDATSDGFQDADASDDDFMQSAPPHWREMAGRLQRSLDADGLLRARRWGNAANGALLAATGPVALTVSLFGFKLSNVVLSLYVTAFGGMLAGVELGVAPIAPWVASNMGYLTTASGRTALLTFLGGLTWPLGKLGVVPALLTCLNAMFNAHFQALLEFVSEDDGQPMDAAPIVDDERDFDPSEAPAVDHSWEAMARVREAVRAADEAAAEEADAERAQQAMATAQQAATAAAMAEDPPPPQASASAAAGAPGAGAAGEGYAEAGPTESGPGGTVEEEDEALASLAEALASARAQREEPGAAMPVDEDGTAGPD